MAARTLSQIIAELNPTYKPQIQSIKKQQSLIPQQTQAAESALNAKKDQAYEDILSGARRRGLGFAGIPLGEQAKYAATDYAPALANLRFQGQQQAMSLQDAILGIRERRDTAALNIRESERARRFQAQQAAKDRRFQARQNALSRASSGGGGGYIEPTVYGGGNGNGNTINYGFGNAQQRKGGGFNFTDDNGSAVSAAVYAKANNIPFRKLLERMAKMGDKGAKQALSFVGNDFGYDPRKINAARASLYNNLVWGSGLSAPNNLIPKGRANSSSWNIGQPRNNNSLKIGKVR